MEFTRVSAKLFLGEIRSFHFMNQKQVRDKDGSRPREKRLAPQKLVSSLIICANFRSSPPSHHLRIFMRMTSLPRGVMLEPDHFATNPTLVNLLLLKA
ncbi:hypothetical protein TNCT_25991 [Trichonephila clavata]|uniref:Uncharacterized protein n=1 Tax=Trichonephila clavata TaxID=2740835 RepID=A0A8X6JUZ4_TRICU|nr:hypothetical protein TNCT_25991 [Trichonephila clavata]